MSALLDVEGVSKTFGGLRAVQDVSFSVEQGTICSVIGPNGAGKTTLFNLISAVLRPDDGHIRFDGIDLTKVPTHRLAGMGIGRTFQNLAVSRQESVVRNILTGMHAQLHGGLLEAAMFAFRARADEITARRRVEEIMAFLEIADIRDKPVGALSYGLQKRVELGRALAMRPRLLLLDEMVSGMNQEEREDIARFILDLKEELNITILMIEHDMGIVMDISDQVCVLHHGSRIAVGSPAEIADDPVVIDAYLGRARAA